MAKPYANPEEEREARIGGARRNLEAWVNRTNAMLSELPRGSLGVAIQAQVISSDGTNKVSKVLKITKEFE